MKLSRILAFALCIFLLGIKWLHGQSEQWSQHAAAARYHIDAQGMDFDDAHEEPVDLSVPQVVGRVPPFIFAAPQHEQPSSWFQGPSAWGRFGVSTWMPIPTAPSLVG